MIYVINIYYFGSSSINLKCRGCIIGEVRALILYTFYKAKYYIGYISQRASDIGADEV